MLYFVIAFFLTLVPFLAIPNCGDGIRTPKEIASIIGFIAIIAISSFYDKKRVNLKWLFLFLLWCVLSTTIFNNYLYPYVFGYFDKLAYFITATAGDNSLYTPIILLAWKELFYITLAIFTIYSIASVDTETQFPPRKIFNFTFSSHTSSIKDQMRNIANLISTISIIMCSYAIIQALGLDNFFKVTNNMGMIATENTWTGTWHFHHKIVGTIGNPTLLAIWLSLLIPFGLYLKNKKGYISIGLILLVLIMTVSATGLIMAVMIMMFWFLFKNKKLFIIGLIILLLAGGMFFAKKDSEFIKDYFGLTGRIKVHQVAWNILKDRPLLGIGLGTFEYMIGMKPEIVEKLSDEQWKELHNEYGQIWWSVGLIGLMIFLGFIISTFVMFLKNISDESIVLASSLVGFLLMCITLFPMRIAPHSFYGVVFIGLLLNIIRRDE